MDCYYNRINKLAGINNSILKKSETNSKQLVPRVSEMIQYF